MMDIALLCRMISYNHGKKKQMHIPKDGLKVVAIIGLKPDGSPVWQKVGVLMNSRNDKPVILLDRSFNPAGCYQEDKTKSSTLLNCFEFSPEELNRRVDNKPPVFNPKTHTTYNSNYEDDIPF